MPSDTVVKPISLNEVPWTEWTDVPRFGIRYKHLSRALLGADYRVGVAIEELGPGKQSAPAHYHVFEEEHVFILEGALTLRLGAAAHEMKAGDYACFPAGQQAGHCLVNNTHAVCRYVIVGEKKKNEVAIYPDTGKMMARIDGKRTIVDLAATRGYWDGEDTGFADAQKPPAETYAKFDAATEGRPPISSDALDWDVEGEGPKFGGHSKHLTYPALGGPDYRVGMLIESPSPGMRLAPRHYHLAEEEHALILEGEVTLLLGDERYVMNPGDYVCFPAGQEIGHSFLNSGPGPCRYLMIGERNPLDVCIYPDSNKLLVRALDRVFDRAATRKYWDGEDVG